MIITIIVGLVGGAVLALVYIVGFNTLVDGIRGPGLPWAVAAAAAGLAQVTLLT